VDKPKHWVKNEIKKKLPNGWVCPYLTQSWVETTQQFLESDHAMCKYKYYRKRGVSLVCNLVHFEGQLNS